jgi:hypothetical protein
MGRVERCMSIAPTKKAGQGIRTLDREALPAHDMITVGDQEWLYDTSIVCYSEPIVVANRTYIFVGLVWKLLLGAKRGHGVWAGRLLRDSLFA